MAETTDILTETIPYTDITVLQIITAAVIIAVGWIATRLIVRLVKNRLSKTALSGLIAEFLARFMSILLYVAVILLAIGALGFDVNGIVIAAGAILGLILAFGMQDTVSNIAAGMWLALLHPFDKGEVVTVNGTTGKVHAVGMLATEIMTADNTYITIPNGIVWGSPITNYTRMETRRVDVAVGIAYSSDMQKALTIARDVMGKNPLILNDPAPAIVTTDLADSSVNLQLRAWTKTGDYWPVKNELTNTILAAYNAQGVEIPFPQMDVHMRKE